MRSHGLACVLAVLILATYAAAIPQPAEAKVDCRLYKGGVYAAALGEEFPEGNPWVGLGSLGWQFWTGPMFYDDGLGEDFPEWAPWHGPTSDDGLGEDFPEKAPVSLPDASDDGLGEEFPE